MFRRNHLLRRVVVILSLVVLHGAYQRCSAVLLDPAVTPVDQFVMPLVVPPEMPPVGPPGSKTYKIAMRQFEQQILPPPYPTTTVWSYGPQDSPIAQTGLATGFHAPSFTIEATKDVPVKVTWINELIDKSGRYLPHLLPVDQTLHWANPPRTR